MTTETLTDPTSREMLLHRVTDFSLTGDRDGEAWHHIPWQNLHTVGKGSQQYETRCKAAYSSSGLYFMVSCEDRILSCTLTEDYENLFTEDVVEIFIKPDLRIPLYLEYEVSPLGPELCILVPNHKNVFSGWRPWNATSERMPRSKTTVYGGEKQSGAKAESWCVEVYLPYKLFTGMGEFPPKSGETWQGNVYRIDYDEGAVQHWAWCEKTGTNFHNHSEFGTFLFE